MDSCWTYTTSLRLQQEHRRTSSLFVAAKWPFCFTFLRLTNSGTTHIDAPRRARPSGDRNTRRIETWEDACGNGRKPSGFILCSPSRRRRRRRRRRRQRLIACIELSTPLARPPPDRLRLGLTMYRQAASDEPAARERVAFCLPNRSMLDHLSVRSSPPSEASWTLAG